MCIHENYYCVHGLCTDMHVCNFGVHTIVAYMTSIQTYFYVCKEMYMQIFNFSSTDKRKKTNWETRYFGRYFLSWYKWKKPFLWALTAAIAAKNDEGEIKAILMNEKPKFTVKDTYVNSNLVEIYGKFRSSSRSIQNKNISHRTSLKCSQSSTRIFKSCVMKSIWVCIWV